jgi:fatty acid desaturase
MSAVRTDSRRAAPFHIRETREIVKDLYTHNPWWYWPDMLLSVAIGYTAASLYLAAPMFTAQQVLGFLIGGFALFRVGSYIHEITHMRHGEMLYFRIAWNILCGIPMLTPSFFYENHIDHHKSPHYGTERDGEYVPLSQGVREIVLFCSQAIVLPPYIVARFLLSPLTFITPAVRNWVLVHMSSFVFNYKHRLTITDSAPRRVWAALELACCLRTWGLVLVVVLGVYPWTRFLQLYALSVFVLGLNYNRNLVAHHYRNDGREMSHQEQLEDSVNIEGGRLTELFFPLNLRYHGLHHLLPTLPYHNLAKAHRRLMAQLPANSAYRQTVYPSYWSVLGELWADARGRRPQAPPRQKLAA